MSIASTLVDPILGLHGVAAYSVVGTLAFAEAAAFVGFVLPGETAVILGGVLAYRHSVSLTAMIVVVVLAAISGDSVGYEIGRRYGQRLLSLRIFARHQRGLDIGRRQLQTKGGRAVLLGRFTAFLRAVTPGLAGVAEMPYAKFLRWNAAGGLIWGVGFTTLGYLAGASYTRIETYAGRLSEVVLVLVVLAAIVYFVRRHRSELDPEASDESGASAGSS